MESRSLRLLTLLDYPRGDVKRGERIYEELKERGVEDLKFISKGYRGVVFKGLLKGKPVAVKVRRSDTPKEVPLKEYEFLSYLFNTFGSDTPAPLPYFSTGDFVVMEWIEGKPFPDAFKEEPRLSTRGALISCYKLDVSKVEHSEIKGEKHLIFTGEDVKVIDFESAKFKERPRNLLQFVGYHLIGRGLYRELGVSLGTLRGLIELYKLDPDEGLKGFLSELKL